MNTTKTEQKTKWKRVLDRRFHYLCVLYAGEKVLGFIFEQGPESLFNCNVGCGDSAQFIGHKPNSILAKEAVELAVQTLV